MVASTFAIARPNLIGKRCVEQVKGDNGQALLRSWGKVQRIGEFSVGRFALWDHCSVCFDFVQRGHDLLFPVFEDAEILFE